MVEIDNSDRSDERRAQERKLDEKKYLEKKMQREPMKTFEAKLSEKTASEIVAKDSQLYRLKQEQKKADEDKKKAIEKVLGETVEQTDEQAQERLAALRHQSEREFEQKNEQTREHRLENKREQRSEEKLRFESGKKSSGEVAEEGHRRVEEKTKGDGGSGGHGQNMAGGGGKGGEEFGQGSRSGAKNLPSQNVAGSQQRTTSYSAVAQTTKTRLMAGFEKNAREFTAKNLDEIVEQVEFGINDFGEEEFTITLSDDYFEGVKIKVTRSDEGIVVTFSCPNVPVRSTFLKYRHQLYLHLMAKNVPVFRIDVR